MTWGREPIRILIVEDVDEVRQDLRAALERKCPETAVVIDEACCVREAKEHIEALKERGLAYDIALLDFRLPLEAGGNPEGDEELCPAISAMNREALVVHMTAFIEDSTILGHIAGQHQGPSAVPLGLVDKVSDPLWIRHVTDSIRSYLAGQYVKAALVAALGPVEGAHVNARFRSPEPPGRFTSGTRLIGDLVAAVQQHWVHLAPEDQALVRKYCGVVPRGDGSETLSVWLRSDDEEREEGPHGGPGVAAREGQHEND